jgi:hypothetical protein
LAYTDDLQIHRENTKYMVISERGARGGLQSGNDCYKSVEYFKCLGSMITTINDVSVDINARLVAGNRGLFRYSRLTQI